MWQHYRDELVTMGMVFAVSAVAVFFLAGRLFTPVSIPEIVVPTATPAPVLGLEQAAPTLAPSPTYVLGVVTPTVGATPSATPTPARVPYGSPGNYAYESYQLDLLSPQLMFEDGADNRKFVIEVVVRNISVAGGIKNNLTASIVKDGNVIVNDAPMSVSESSIVLPGEQLTFTARLSLIEGTDVVAVRFAPEGQPETEHELQ